MVILSICDSIAYYVLEKYIQEAVVHPGLNVQEDLKVLVLCIHIVEIFAKLQIRQSWETQNPDH